MFAVLDFSSSEAKSLKDDVTLDSQGLKDGSALYFKDLGPQIGWKTVSLHKCYSILYHLVGTRE